MSASQPELSALSFPELVIASLDRWVDLDQIALSFKAALSAFLTLRAGQTHNRNEKVPCYSRGPDTRHQEVGRA